MSLHRLLMIIIILCVIFGGGITILQMWSPVISWDIFIKLLATLGILIVIMGLVLVLKSDLGEYKKMKDENYLD